MSEETQVRYYILEKKVGTGRFKQIGIVLAPSIREAAEKIKMPVVEVVLPPVSHVAYCELEFGYCLSEIPEVGL